MSEVKRCYYTGSLMVLASDYDRLEQECERLRHSAANDLLDRLATELLDSGAENYQESVFDLDLGSESLTASVMLRYRDKPSAHELRMSAEAERDALRAQVGAMRAIGNELANTAFNLAQQPGYILTQRVCDQLSDSRKRWDAVSQVNRMNKYQVKFFYLATGMEGHADIRSYGIIEASSSEEAVNKVIEANYSSMSNEDKNFLRGCLSATLVPDNENRSE